MQEVQEPLQGRDYHRSVGAYSLDPKPPPQLNNSQAAVKRHNIIRSLLAAALQNKGLEVYEEIHCSADQDSVWRIDIIAINTKKSVAEIIDPTIRFEQSKAQPNDVDQEKKEI
ncbi:hypothetical protein ANN_17381 [Periplaneta americana]|uniref:Uncharacterized protein n=1 Tax=Periplaneta americana TaxID=6978 RepID=A0ABQ8SST1_PERAM|nr:hypothetical protein ANN_17381 [Periplaneta americana]